MSIFRSILDNFDDAIKLIDDERTVVYANKAAERLFRSDLVGKHCSELLHEGQLISEQITEVIRRQETRTKEFIQKSPEGIKHYYDLHIIPMKDESGNTLFLVKTIDITARKLIENEIFQKERLATLGQIASNIAHEIRNPITGIRLGLDILEPKLSSGNDAEIFQGISSDIDRLDGILKQLLDYAKVKKKSREFVKINQLLNESLVLLRKEAEQKGIRIVTEFSEILPEIKLDKGQIHQAIVNIVLNSIQAIDGIGTITIKTTHVNINDILGVQIIVEDNGCGIPEENLFRINNLFFTTKEEGTGLGLPMSQKIIREHGGSIVFESEEKVGTSVKLFLPIEI